MVAVLVELFSGNEGGRSGGGNEGGSIGSSSEGGSIGSGSEGGSIGSGKPVTKVAAALKSGRMTLNDLFPDIT